MENFKFELTNEQVRLLHWILEDYFTRLSNRAIIIEMFRNQPRILNNALIEINTLCVEFNLQTDKYLRDNNLDSFIDESDFFKKF